MPKKYLLDSNIFIHILRKRPEVRTQIERVGWENCCIAEPSIVELLYGAECSASPEKNLALVEELLKITLENRKNINGKRTSEMDALYGILLFTYNNVIIFFYSFMQNSRMAYRGRIYVKSNNKTVFCLSKS